MAEVMNYNDFKEEGSEAAAKVRHSFNLIWNNFQSKIAILLQQAAGKYRQQGKNYTVEDGDIIFFKFNAGAGLTAGKKK